jgi:hypothetical protein
MSFGRTVLMMGEASNAQKRGEAGERHKKGGKKENSRAGQPMACEKAKRQAGTQHNTTKREIS